LFGLQEITTGQTTGHFLKGEKEREALDRKCNFFGDESKCWP